MEYDWNSLYEITPWNAKNFATVFCGLRNEHDSTSDENRSDKNRSITGTALLHSGKPCSFVLIVLRLLDPKQLLRVSCIWWYYFEKWSSIISHYPVLWCFSFIRYGSHYGRFFNQHDHKNRDNEYLQHRFVNKTQRLILLVLSWVYIGSYEADKEIQMNVQ